MSKATPQDRPAIRAIANAGEKERTRLQVQDAVHQKSSERSEIQEPRVAETA
jgi:hypothetical protein